MHYLKTLENGDANEVIGDNWSPKLNPVLPPLLRVFHALPPTFPAPVAAPLTHVIHSLITIPVSPPLCVEWFAASPRSSGTSSPKGKHVAAPAPPIFIPPSPRRTPTPPPPPAARTSLWGPAISSPLHSHAECALRAAAVRACTPPRCSSRPHPHAPISTCTPARPTFSRAETLHVQSLRSFRCANPPPSTVAPTLPPLDLARTRTRRRVRYATPVSAFARPDATSTCTSAKEASGACARSRRPAAVPHSPVYRTPRSSTRSPPPPHPQRAASRTHHLHTHVASTRTRAAFSSHASRLRLARAAAASHALPPRAPHAAATRTHALHHLHTPNEPRAAHSTARRTPTLPQRAPAPPSPRTHAAPPPPRRRRPYAFVCVCTPSELLVSAPLHTPPRLPLQPAPTPDDPHPLARPQIRRAVFARPNCLDRRTSRTPNCLDRRTSRTPNCPHRRTSRTPHSPYASPGRRRLASHLPPPRLARTLLPPRTHARTPRSPSPRMPDRCLNVHPRRLPLARTHAAFPSHARCCRLARTLLPPRPPLPPRLARRCRLASNAAAASPRRRCRLASHAAAASPRTPLPPRLARTPPALARTHAAPHTHVRGSLTSLLITLAGGLIQSFLTLQLLGSWQSLRALDAESELDAWKLDGLRVLWGLLAMYLLAAAFVSFVGFFGVVRPKSHPQSRPPTACTSPSTTRPLRSSSAPLGPTLRMRLLAGVDSPRTPLPPPRLARTPRRTPTLSQRVPAPSSPRTRAAFPSHARRRRALPPTNSAASHESRAQPAPSPIRPCSFDVCSRARISAGAPRPASAFLTHMHHRAALLSNYIAALSSCARLRSSPQPELAPTAPAFNFILSIQTLSTRLELLLYCITLVSFTQTDKWISSQSTPLQVGGFRKAAC
ncbi:hypothetical protein B0H16DRAFT_1830925 [Mycena metata]|uniref:Uncharacterized protein n=1 Tax=Mycena metata TaxID=1033252 RepID=A0AAD7J1S0_9AGAR|nr:hypothetical protein B0H16DRAFT_1830925 [Mycena metata]